jgi:transcriptional regulator with XRE-family HTH domain
MRGSEGRLAAYLRGRRTQLDPLALGLPPGRRPTPGLRREEVARRAGISPTSYTWLEQGRGGSPSGPVLDDYAALAPAERNVLRQLFLNPQARAAQADWLSVARFAVATFLADAARVGADAEMRRLVEDLPQQSQEFAQLWRAEEIAWPEGGTKRQHHPELGPLDLEFSVFAVAGRPELGMVVFNPGTTETADRMRAWLAGPNI